MNSTPTVNVQHLCLSRWGWKAPGTKPATAWRSALKTWKTPESLSVSSRAMLNVTDWKLTAGRIFHTFRLGAACETRALARPPSPHSVPTRATYLPKFSTFLADERHCWLADVIRGGRRRSAVRGAATAGGNCEASQWGLQQQGSFLNELWFWATTFISLWHHNERKAEWRKYRWKESQATNSYWHEFK